MMKSVTLEDCEALIANEQWVAAKSACLSYLDQHVDDADGYHLLALLYAQENELEQATVAIEQALQFEQKPAFYLHLSNILKRQNRLREAKDVLYLLLEQYPDYAAAQNNLGIIFFQEEDWESAITAYKAAIDLQSYYPDAYYNLALSYIRADKLSLARQALEALLELDSSHVGAIFQLGRMAMQLGHYQKAIVYLSDLSERHPFHFETLANLATCYLKLDKTRLAKEYYLKAHAVSKNDTQVLFNLGVIASREGRVDEATHYFEKVLIINPQHVEALNNLGIHAMSQQQKEKAIGYFKQVLNVNPENVAIAHTIKILQQDQSITETPVPFIKSLFNSYADYYDKHLQESLQYQVPDAVAKVIDLELINDELTVVDLGCGTGLCAQSLRRCAKKLIGVDVAEKMLAIADKKKLYDELVLSDISDYLKQHPGQYDLLVAGDVLVYFGDLVQVFALMVNSLVAGGRIIFNVETAKNNKFSLTVSGRFAHHPDYIQSLAQRYHLEMTQASPLMLRTQNNKQVQGQLYVLTKLS